MTRYVIENKGEPLKPGEADGGNFLLDPEDQVTEADLNSDTAKMMQRIRTERERREREERKRAS